MLSIFLHWECWETSKRFATEKLTLNDEYFPIIRNSKSLYSGWLLIAFVFASLGVKSHYCEKFKTVIMKQIFYCSMMFYNRACFKKDKTRHKSYFWQKFCQKLNGKPLVIHLFDTLQCFRLLWRVLPSLRTICSLDPQGIIIPELHTIATEG